MHGPWSSPTTVTISDFDSGPWFRVLVSLAAFRVYGLGFSVYERPTHTQMW